MTRPLSRRQLIKQAGVLSLAGLMPTIHFKDAMAGSTAVAGKAHMISVYATKPTDGTGLDVAPDSMLTTLDLKTGAVKQTEIPIKKGHVASPLGDGRLFCVAHHGQQNIVIDPDHKLMQSFDAPEGYLFGGHGLLLKDEGVFVAPVRHHHAMTVDDHGLLMVYDLKTMKLLDQVSSDGLHPHEIHPIPGTNELVLTHYGEIEHTEPGFKFMQYVVEPKLTIIDRKTLKPIRHYVQPKDINGMLTHMHVDAEGHAYCVLTQYVKHEVFDPNASAKEKELKARMELSKALKKAVSFKVPDISFKERRIAVPLPVLRINTQTGEREVISVQDKLMLRAQSVACNQQTGYAIATYHHSGNLMLHKGGGEPIIIEASKIGLDTVRGVRDVPGTPYMLISGSEGGVAIFDTSTMQTVQTFTDMKYRAAPHVDFEPA